MRAGAAFILAFALAAASAAGEPNQIDWPAVKSRAFPTALDHLKVVKLLLLDPSATRENTPTSTARFHGWVVAASAIEVDASSGNSLILSMRAIVGSPKEGLAACFDPHHGAILSDGHRSYDAVVCFKCARYEVFGADGELIWGGSFTKVKSEEFQWNRIFRSAGLGNGDRIAPAPNKSLERTRER
jgi:hypothetical protein